MCGNHDAAQPAAGIDPPLRQRPRLWSQTRIFAALRQRIAQGKAVNVAAIKQSDSPLSGAIRRYFASHDSALRAAGIDPGPMRCRTWNKPEVLAHLRDRRARGLGMNDGAIQSTDAGLAQAIRKYVGSHDQALREIGVDPATVRNQSCV